MPKVIRKFYRNGVEYKIKFPLPHYVEYPVTSSMYLYLPLNIQRWLTDMSDSPQTVTADWYTIWLNQWVESANVTWYIKASIWWAMKSNYNYTISFWAYIPSSVESKETMFYVQSNNTYSPHSIFVDTDKKIYYTTVNSDWYSTQVVLADGISWWAYFVSTKSKTERNLWVFQWNQKYSGSFTTNTTYDANVTLNIWCWYGGNREYFKDWYLSNLVFDKTTTTEEAATQEYNKYKSYYWY